jgi:hypothetical protein
MPKLRLILHSPQPSPPFWLVRSPGLIVPSFKVHTDSCRLHPSSKALSQMPKTLPTSTPKVSILSLLSLLLPLPSSLQHTVSISTLQHPPSTTSNRLAGLTSPVHAHALPQPTADETHCRPTARTTHDKTRQQLLYHQSGYTAPLPSADPPPLPRRRCCEIAHALCWQPSRPQRPTRSICLCLLRLVSQAIWRGLFVFARQYKALVVVVAAVTLAPRLSSRTRTSTRNTSRSVQYSTSIHQHYRQSLLHHTRIDSNRDTLACRTSTP